MRRLLISILVLLLLLSQGVMGQSKFAHQELGLDIGGTNYLGDLNNQSMFGKVHLAYGAHFRYKFNDRWAVLVNGALGKLEGGNPDVIPSRNLYFRSDIWEASFRVEFNFLPFGMSGRQACWCPFLFGGLGLFHFNPMAQYTDPATGITDWVELQPLGTEGQGLAQYPDRELYGRLQAMLPFGLGVKYRPSKYLVLAVEYGYRKTWTDYIDDVSTTYVEPWLLSSEAAALADPAPATGAKADSHHAVGLKRGDDSLNDWYAYMNVSVNVSMEYLLHWMLKKRCEH